MVDPAALTAVLGPALPYLLSAADRAADDAVADLGDEAWARARAIWAKLHPHLAERPAAVEAAADVASRPGDARARGALELQLEKLIADNPDLVTQLGALLGGPKTVASIGERSVAVGGSVSGTVVTGDSNTVER